MNETIPTLPEMNETERDLDNIFVEISLMLSKKLVNLENVLAYYQAKVDKLNNQRNKIIFLLDSNKKGDIAYWEDKVPSHNESSVVKLTPTPHTIEPSEEKKEVMILTDPPIIQGEDDDEEEEEEVEDLEHKKVSYSDLDETEIAGLVEKYFITVKPYASLLQLREWIRPKINYKLRGKVDLFYLFELITKREELYRKTAKGDYRYLKGSHMPNPERLLPMSRIVDYYYTHIRKSSSFSDLERWLRENYPERIDSKTLNTVRSYLHNRTEKYTRVARAWYKYIPHVPKENYLYPEQEINDSNSWKVTIQSAVQYYFENIARCSHVYDVHAWIVKNTDFKTVKRTTIQASLSMKKHLYEFKGDKTYQYIPFVAKPYQNELPKDYPIEEQLENNQ